MAVKVTCTRCGKVFSNLQPYWGNPSMVCATCKKEKR